MSITLDWTTIGGLAVVASAIAWLVRLQMLHQSHEKICAERYQHISETHEQLVKVSDERHEENRDRLESIDHKIDLLISRHR